MQFLDILLTLIAVVLAGWYLWRTLIVRKGCAGCSSGCGSQCGGQGSHVVLSGQFGCSGRNFSKNGGNVNKIPLNPPFSKGEAVCAPPLVGVTPAITGMKSEGTNRPHEPGN